MPKTRKSPASEREAVVIEKATAELAKLSGKYAEHERETHRILNTLQADLPKRSRIRMFLDKLESIQNLQSCIPSVLDDEETVREKYSQALQRLLLAKKTYLRSATRKLFTKEIDKAHLFCFNSTIDFVKAELGIGKSPNTPLGRAAASLRVAIRALRELEQKEQKQDSDEEEEEEE